MPKELREILLSGVVGLDITVEGMKAQLDEAKAENQDVQLLISSGGGSVFQGIAISNLISNFPGKTESRIIGLAASMATVIALSADSVTAEDDAIFMIHNASGGAYGTKAEMAKMQAVLGKIDNMILNKYTTKTGRPKAEIQDEMDDETFFFGDEMKKAGFVDKMLKGKGKDKKAALDDAELQILAAMDMNFNDSAYIARVAAELTGLQETEPEQKPAVINERDESALNQESIIEETNMDLKEFLAQNPDAKKEHDALIEAAEKKGADSVQARIEAVTPFMGSVYPDKVKNQIPKVLTGAVPVETFKMAIEMLDIGNESESSNEAANETEEQGSTPAESKKENETESNYQARLKRLKDGK